MSTILTRAFHRRGRVRGQGGIADEWAWLAVKFVLGGLAVAGLAVSIIALIVVAGPLLAPAP